MTEEEMVKARGVPKRQSPEEAEDEWYGREMAESGGVWEVVPVMEGDKLIGYQVRWSLPDPEGRYQWVGHYYAGENGEYPIAWCAAASERHAKRLNETINPTKVVTATEIDIRRLKARERPSCPQCHGAGLKANAKATGYTCCNCGCRTDPKGLKVEGGGKEGMSELEKELVAEIKKGMEAEYVKEQDEWEHRMLYGDGSVPEPQGVVKAEGSKESGPVAATSAEVTDLLWKLFNPTYGPSERDAMSLIHSCLCGDRGVVQKLIATRMIEFASLALRKNADYGSTVFRPPRYAPEIKTDAAIRVRLSDKMDRFRTLLKKPPEVVNESLEDAAGDSAVYLILWLIKRRADREGIDLGGDDGLSGMGSGPNP